MQGGRSIGGGKREEEVNVYPTMYLVRDEEKKERESERGFAKICVEKLVDNEQRRRKRIH